MPCDHTGGPELIEMAETYLHQNGIPEVRWPGLRFRWSENLDNGLWAAVILEIERRGDQWLVVRIDRRREPVESTGFTQV
jgi:hypothetical protein